MTTAEVNVSCPHCRQEYRLRIDLERLMRLRSRVVCSQCRKSFDVASRLGDRRRRARSLAQERMQREASSTPPYGMRIPGEAETAAHVSGPPKPFSEEPGFAPPDVLDALRSLPPGSDSARVPLGAPPPLPFDTGARSSSPVSRPSLSSKPAPRPRVATLKPQPAVAEASERTHDTAPPPPNEASLRKASMRSEPPSVLPPEPPVDRSAEWLALADPGLESLDPQSHSVTGALGRLLLS